MSGQHNKYDRRRIRRYRIRKRVVGSPERPRLSVYRSSTHIYHGRVKALADGARAGGLEF